MTLITKMTDTQVNRSFYYRWNGLRTRCTNKKYEGYKNYGGRGITYKWPDFESFHKDMYKSYLKAIQIYGEGKVVLDRIDNDKGYYKENCRWGDSQNSNRNRRSPTRWSKERVDRMFSLKKSGVTFPKLAEILGVSLATVTQAYYRKNNSVNKFIK